MDEAQPAAARNWLLKPSQETDEREAFARLLRRKHVRSYLEIGLRVGQTFEYVGDRLAAGSNMVGVDLQGVGLERWGLPDDQTAMAKTMIQSVAARLRRRHTVTIIWGDSTSAGTIEAVRARGPYDVVFIDGDHSPAGVRADWMNYGPMARIVAFHDIDTPAARKKTAVDLARYGVHDLWRELRPRFEHREIIGRHRGKGIGVLFQPCQL